MLGDVFLFFDEARGRWAARAFDHRLWDEVKLRPGTVVQPGGSGLREYFAPIEDEV